MANRRMFSKEITNNDKFTEMSSDAQSLYFHLGMNADDDGFISPKGIMRLINAPDDSLKLLIAKKFVIPFESGVLVIVDWKENNYIQADRYRPTRYQNELKQLDCIHNVYNLYTQDSIGKDRIGKDSTTESNKTLSLKSNNKYDGYVPVDFESPLNREKRFIKKHRIVYSTNGKKYGIPPNGGEYIPYEDLIKLTGTKSNGKL